MTVYLVYQRYLRRCWAPYQGRNDLDQPGAGDNPGQPPVNDAAAQPFVRQNVAPHSSVHYGIRGQPSKINSSFTQDQEETALL